MPFVVSGHFLNAASCKRLSVVVVVVVVAVGSEMYKTYRKAAHTLSFALIIIVLHRRCQEEKHLVIVECICGLFLLFQALRQLVSF